MLGLAVLLVGATVALHVDEGRGLPADQLSALMESAVGVLGASGIEATLHRDRCVAKDRCDAEVRAATGASDVVRLRILAVPTRIRVHARRVGASGYTVASGHADLGRDPESWPRGLKGLALILFPPVEAPEALVATGPPPAQTGLHWAVPASVTGAGAVLAAAGFGFGASSDAARFDVETMPHSAMETEALLGRAHDHGLAATVLVSVGAAAVVTGVVLWLID